MVVGGVGLVDAVGLEVEWVEPVAASYEGGGSSGTGEGASGKGVLLGIFELFEETETQAEGWIEALGFEVNIVQKSCVMVQSLQMLRCEMKREEVVITGEVVV